MATDPTPQDRQRFLEQDVPQAMDVPTPVERQQALATAAALKESMDSLCSKIEEVQKAGSKSRRMIYGLAASLLLNVLLSIGLIFTVIRVDNASEEAHRAALAAEANGVSQYESCMATNEVRRLQVLLWTKVLGVVGAERLPEAPQLEAFVITVFAPRVCEPPR